MELSASQITSSAKKELTLRGVKIWRNNNLAVKGRKFIGERGVPDLIGYKKGLFVGCEIKKIGDKFKKEQIDFLTDLHNAGGIALYATQEGNRVVIKSFI